MYQFRKLLCVLLCFSMILTILFPVYGEVVEDIENSIISCLECGSIDGHLDNCSFNENLEKEEDDSVCNCDFVYSIHADTCPLFVVLEESEESIEECICGTETDIHLEDCPLYKEIIVESDNLDNISFEFLIEVTTLSELYYMITDDTSVIDLLVVEEKEKLSDKVNALYLEIEEPTEEDSRMKDELLELLVIVESIACEYCGLIDSHSESCELYVCLECGLKEHSIDCSKYIEKCLECGELNGVHLLACSQYICSECGLKEHSNECSQYISICEECLEKNGLHLESCSLYICGECGLKEHSKECSNYKKPELAPAPIKCEECGGENEEHLESCSLYICSECGENQHVKGCSKYIDNRPLYIKLLDSDLIGIYELLTDYEEQEEVNNLTTVQIEEVIYYVGLISDDEDLEIEILMILYELPNAPVAPWKTLEENYIYFDLYYGNISITGTTYSGYNSSGVAISGTHTADNQYYIYQSKGASTVWENGLPVYEPVSYNGEYWGDYITNHPDKSTKGSKSVDEVITAWGSVNHKATTVSSGAAFNSGRVPTPNYIKVVGNSTFNIVIDNIWSSYQVKYSTSQQDSSSFKNDLGGLVFVAEKTNSLLNLYLVGDNRFGNIHAATNDGRNGKYTVDTNHTNTITIQTLSGENDSTLTLCNLWTDADTNSTASCIGGTDGRDHSAKMIFNSGIIYAGSGYKDFCTPIGGGGNGDGRVIINGGIITAVNSSTGAAIGGGCGTTGPGGYGEVHITDGEVYAYSYSVYYNSTSYFNNALPTAIGGGSSGTQIGGIGIVEISGGYIYAYSEVGNAIGGGGGGYGIDKASDTTYNSCTGGIADIVISGGEIHAISGSGCAIGGGPGGGRSYDAYYTTNSKLPNDTLEPEKKVVANGGDATLIITGGTIYTGSIGGGSPQFHNGTDKNKYGFTIGAAQVYMQGGKLHGQIVMEGEGSIFEMDRGTIDNSFIDSDYNFVKNDGGAVYIKTGNATMNGGKIIDASAENGGAIYVRDGDFLMTGGEISNCSSNSDGGAIYVYGGNVTMTDGIIKNNTANNNGGAIYVESELIDVTVNIEGGEICNNTALNNGGAVGADMLGSSICHIIVGLEECKCENLTLHEGDACPEIYDNHAEISGGAFYCQSVGNTESTDINDHILIVDLFCSNIHGNVANKFNASNSLHEENGYFTIYAGEIDDGFLVDGGVFRDLRPKKVTQIVRFWSNYDGGPTECYEEELTVGYTMFLPTDTYERDGHLLSGWSKSEDGSNGFIPIGGTYTVEKVDGYIDFYAVWDTQTSYIVYIPESLSISSITGQGSAEISAELEYFSEGDLLTIYINSDFLLNSSDTDFIIPFSVKTSEPGVTGYLKDGDVIATFSYNNARSKVISLFIDNNADMDEGYYSGSITFIVDFNSSENRKKV